MGAMRSERPERPECARQRARTDTQNNHNQNGYTQRGVRAPAQGPPEMKIEKRSATNLTATIK